MMKSYTKTMNLISKPYKSYKYIHIIDLYILINYPSLNPIHSNYYLTQVNHYLPFLFSYLNNTSK